MTPPVETVAVGYKIQPILIPTTAIRKVDQFPNSSGGLGDVWKCYMSTQSETRTVAVKSIRVPQASDEVIVRKAGTRIRREAHMWIKLSHDHILPFEGVTEGFGQLPALVTPWMENGSLNDYLRREVGLSKERKLTMAREVAAGLQYLHDEGVVHGDLTGINVLVSSEGRLCLGGVGLAMILVEAENTTINSCHLGNIRWMGPEVLEDQDLKPTMDGDIYSYGCILMQVFSGRQPYEWAKSAYSVMSAIQRGSKPFSQLTASGIDEEIQRFAQLCLSRIRADRPLVAGIVEFLWSQTNVAETMKTMLSKPPVTVTQISGEALTKCDYHAGDSDVLGSALKCKWVHESGETEVAVKTLRDDVNSQNDINKIFNRIRREMYVREKLRHETILALYGMTAGFGILPSLVYPWMAGGSLHDYLKREYSNLPARRKLNILLEVAHGIEYLHKQGIVHGNLTGDNIFLAGSGRVCIADFSHSTVLAEEDNRMFSEQLPGDARYTAPKFIFSGDQTGAPKPTRAGDVYSYGCVAILILSGKVPYWWISEESQVFSEKEKGTEPFRPTVEIDEVHLNLVRQCLSAEKSRPSIEKVLYLVLVQSFDATDLTNSVQRPNKVYQACGGFANVHKCKLHLRDISAVQQVVFRYQFPSMSTCADVAVKEIILSHDADMLTIINRLIREITLWLKLEHKNIVPLWGVADGFGSLPAPISPWLENGALTGYLQREYKMLSYNRKFTLLEDVTRGLQYLHLQSIIHGDLSGNNVLVDKNGTASLTDFGLSAFLPDRMSQALLPTNHMCTVSYMAPEHLIFDDEDNVSPVFTPKSDVYAFGGIMLQVLEGKVPYHYIRKPAAIINSISRGITPKRPPTSVVSDSDWDFMQICWSGDMKRRPSDEDILEFVEGRARIQS